MEHLAQVQMKKRRKTKQERKQVLEAKTSRGRSRLTDLSVLRKPGTTSK
jgi:hypothetical protein